MAWAPSYEFGQCWARPTTIRCGPLTSAPQIPGCDGLRLLQWQHDYVNGTHVPNMSALSCNRWDGSPTELTAELHWSLFTASMREGKAYAIETSRSGEWFLIENRQKEGWDEELPGHGMLIWHINYDKQTWDNDAANDNRKPPTC